MGRAFTMSFDQKGKGLPVMSNLKEIYERMYMANSPAAKAKLKIKENLLNKVLTNTKDLKRRPSDS